MKFLLNEGCLGIDWFTGTLPYEFKDDFRDFVSDFVGEKPISYCWGRMRYNNHYDWFNSNIKLFYDDNIERCDKLHAGRLSVVISGQGMQRLSGEEMFSMFRTFINRFWVKSTRLDLCYDDYRDERLLPEEVKKCCDVGNYSGFRKYAYTEENTNNIRTAEMVSFGTRGKNGSGAYLRYYDKNLESKGAIDACRWELELSKEKACDVFFRLVCCNDLDEFTTLIGALIGGSVRFLEKRDANLSRCKDLEWWAEVVKDIGRAFIRLQKDHCDIDKTIEWVENSVSPALGKIKCALGEIEFVSWLENMVNISAKSLSVRDLKAVDWYLNHGDNCV